MPILTLNRWDLAAKPPPVPDARRRPGLPADTPVETPRRRRVVHGYGTHRSSRMDETRPVVASAPTYPPQGDRLTSDHERAGGCPSGTASTWG